MGGRLGMVELDSVLKSSALAHWNRYNRCSRSTQILDGEDWGWGEEETTGDDTNACTRSQDNATAALSLRHFVSGVSGWGRSIGGGLGTVELDLVWKSSALAFWNKYNKCTSESRSWSTQISYGKDWAWVGHIVRLTLLNLKLFWSQELTESLTMHHWDASRELGSCN